MQANEKQKKADVAILTSDKADFKKKQVKRDKQGQYMMIKRTIPQEAMTLVNIYAPNTGAPTISVVYKATTNRTKRRS